MKSAIDDTLAGLSASHCACAVAVIDESGLVRFLNPAAERLFGAEARSLVGKPFPFPPADSHRQATEVVRAADGSWSAEMRVEAATIDGQEYRVATLWDCTEKEQLSRSVRAMMFTDELTGLLNRRGFLTLSQQQLKIADRTRRGMLLLLVDIEGMRAINESRGRAVGDVVLLEAANVIRDTFRACDIMARIGGDEFAVMAIEARKESADEIRRRLRANLQKRNAGADAGHRFSVRLSTLFYEPARPCSLDELLARLEATLDTQS
jgi:diguanylate cyclase (GGDEF)-like protein